MVGSIVWFKTIQAHLIIVRVIRVRKRLREGVFKKRTLESNPGPNGFNTSVENSFVVPQAYHPLFVWDAVHL